MISSIRPGPETGWSPVKKRCINKRKAERSLITCRPHACIKRHPGRISLVNWFKYHLILKQAEKCVKPGARELSGKGMIIYRCKVCSTDIPYTFIPEISPLASERWPPLFSWYQEGWGDSNADLFYSVFSLQVGNIFICRASLPTALQNDPYAKRYPEYPTDGKMIRCPGSFYHSIDWHSLRKAMLTSNIQWGVIGLLGVGRWWEG